MIENFVTKGETVAAYLLYSASQKELMLSELFWATVRQETQKRSDDVIHVPNGLWIVEWLCTAWSASKRQKGLWGRQRCGERKTKKMK